MMLSVIVAPGTVFFDRETGIAITNRGNRHIAVQWNTIARTVTTTPEEERESKALFINHRGIADSSGNWLSRVPEGYPPPPEVAENLELAGSEDQAVASDDATPSEPMDVRLNIFKLFE